jgi:arginine decarboxylase
MDLNTSSEPLHIDEMFTGPGARADRWQHLSEAAELWAARRGAQSDVQARFERVALLEMYYAFPGREQIAALRRAINSGDAASVLAKTRWTVRAILERAYRSDPRYWSAPEEAGVQDYRSSTDTPAKPYFELLVVSAQPVERFGSLGERYRAARRAEDEFFYEPVIVGSYEDALCAIALNAAINVVIVAEGVALRADHDAPELRQFIDPALETAGQEAVALRLCHEIKTFRPELDIYVISDRDVESMAGAAAAAEVRRVFYTYEEPNELHFTILEGIRERFQSPFFDNLKAYARRPMGTFHALPIARGKSVFKSDWIHDFGDFYGLNLFLAESSATTGGLDSLLEPSGNIKTAQHLAARAFGADHAFFVTNGTSTSNKIVHQALCAPGDIVILDRNCHKSHHYGCVLAGAQPLYVEAYPLADLSMYGAVPLSELKRAMLTLKREGRLDRLRLIDLTNCTFDGHMYNTRRVMEECLAIKPDVIFLWDEAWSAFARWSPFLRPRTALGGAEAVERYLATPEALTAYDAQAAELGEAPSMETLLATRLVPDPRQVRLRVYQTSSTHKSLSAIRQGSMIMVKDVDFHSILSQFHEAIYTHASTSPNQQLIASLDVARRQMELEGYGLVRGAIDIALAIRRAVANHPLISRYFSIAGADRMIPDAYRQSGFTDFLKAGTHWGHAIRAAQEDEFILDPTRMTLICGRAGFDGTEFKGLLAEKYDIQVNKTSRNSVLLQSNINNTRSDIAQLIRVLADISAGIEKRLHDGGPPARKAFDDRVTALMSDVPELPNFSAFHPAFRTDAGADTPEGDMRAAFYKAYDLARCEYVPIDSAACEARLKSGPPMVAANFIIPYPPGFPILVPGQVVTPETVAFMRKLDVKEIHGYEPERGLRLIRPEALQG